MAHNQRIFPDVVYVNGAPIPSAYFQALDTAQSKGINGDSGGTWTPAAPITIGGAGMWFGGPSTISGGAQIRTPLGSGKRITHSADDWFTFQTGGPQTTRNRVTPLGTAIDCSTIATQSFGGPSFPAFVPKASFGGFQDGMLVSNVGARFIAALTVHNFCHIASCTVSLLVSPAHNVAGSAPASLPMVRMFRVDALGNVTNLQSDPTTTGWAGNGFVQFPAQASNVAWYNAGNPQTLLYFTNDFVAVDTSKFSYFVEIIDESGANAFVGNYYLTAVVQVNAIRDMRPQ